MAHNAPRLRQAATFAQRRIKIINVFTHANIPRAQQRTRDTHTHTHTKCTAALLRQTTLHTNLALRLLIAGISLASQLSFCLPCDLSQINCSPSLSTNSQRMSRSPVRDTLTRALPSERHLTRNSLSSCTRWSRTSRRFTVCSSYCRARMPGGGAFSSGGGSLGS
jgi:hypothetical protein